MSKRFTCKVYPTGMARSVYRTIQVSDSETLDTLCAVIVGAFNFYHEHLYEFCMDNKPYHPGNFQAAPQPGELSTKIRLNRLNLVKGQNFSLHYDFGDDWMFTIHVQTIEEEEAETSPALINSKGKIKQYPSWDEDEEEEEDDEDWE